MNTLHKHIGYPLTTKQLRNFESVAFRNIKDRAFITIFHSDTYEELWYPILLNKRHMKWDKEITIEFCREQFGNTKFGIANGQQAKLGTSVFDNL